MIRPPSLYKDVTDFFTGDSAIVQPPPLPADDATEEQVAEFKEAVKQYFAAITSAKETGDWTAVVVAGQTPTKFVMGQVDRNVWRALLDRATLKPDNPRYIGEVVTNALLFRLSIRSIVGFDKKIEREPDPHWDGWVMAKADIIQALDDIDPRIVGEIGAGVFRRLQGISPKF